jgi:membrane-associated protease RseP (regulator of RpoE activity)
MPYPSPEHAEQPIEFVERVEDPSVRRDDDVDPKPERRAKYLILFLLTFVSATLAGAWYYASFRTDLGNSEPSLSLPSVLLNGLWYSVPALAILTAHEFGHYFACRYYGIRSSLPYYLPLWLPVNAMQFGTLGAVIRIRQPIRFKRQLFDVGIAGPIAGFVVLVPVLLIGLSLSNIVPLPPDFSGVDIGTPLLFRFAQWLVVGDLAPGYEINVHPMGWAAWFGLLATALNLAPIGQLDGGHIAYAVLGRKSTGVSVLVVLALVGLSAGSSGSYAFFTGLIVVMLFLFGPHHPRVVDEEVPLDRVRLWLALVAAIILVLSFTPIPMSTWTGSGS